MDARAYDHAVARRRLRDRPHDRRGDIGREAPAQEDPLTFGALHLALRLHDVHPPVAVQVAQRQSKRARSPVSHEDIVGGPEVTCAVIEQEPVRPAQRADHEIGVAVRVDVEERHDVIVLADVLALGPPGVGRVEVDALAVVAEHVLPAAGADPAHDLAVVHGDQIEEAVAVEVHRLVLVVVRVLRKATRVGDEQSRPIVAIQRTAAAALAGNQDIEVEVVVDVDEFQIPREPYQLVWEARGRAVGESPRAVVEPKPDPTSRIAHVVPRPPVGEHEVQVTITVHVTGLGVAHAEQDGGQVRRGAFDEPPRAVGQIQPALGLIRRPDEDVDPTVAVEVARLHDAGEVRRGPEDLRAPLYERPPRTPVVEGPVELRRAGRRVVASVRKQDVEESVTIEISQLDLVGPLGGRSEQRVSRFDPERPGDGGLGRRGVRPADHVARRAGRSEECDGSREGETTGHGGWVMGWHDQQLDRGRLTIRRDRRSRELPLRHERRTRSLQKHDA